MKKILGKGVAWAIGFLITCIVILGISWLGTCGVVKLITLCFGIDFTWGIGTGVWLILLLLGSIIPKSK